MSDVYNDVSGCLSTILDLFVAEGRNSKHLLRQDGY